MITQNIVHLILSIPVLLHCSDGMKLVVEHTNYEKQIQLAAKLRENNTVYEGDVIFHAFWCGEITEKHLISIRSCHRFNVLDSKGSRRINRRIIQWMEQSSISDALREEIERFATIKQFDFKKEINGTLMADFRPKHDGIPFYADLVRLILLYNYGGCWFDLDIFFLKNVDPVFAEYADQICMYQWEAQNYPNNAIFFSLQPQSPALMRTMESIRRKGNGWGCQEAKLLYSDESLEITVLPVAWFDPSWIKNSINFHFNDFFKAQGKRWDFTSFFPNSFAYHWHNKWNDPIELGSACQQLNAILKRRDGEKRKRDEA